MMPGAAGDTVMKSRFVVMAMLLSCLGAGTAWAQDSFRSQPMPGQPMQGQMQGQPGFGGGMPPMQPQMQAQPWGQQGGQPPGAFQGGGMQGQMMPGQGMSGQGMPGQAMPNQPMMGGQPPMMGNPMMGNPMPGGPQPGFGMPPQPGGFAMPGQPPRGGGGDPLDQIAQMERQDFGVPPPQGLHAGAFHSPTPNSIPGAQVITTKGLMPLIQNQQVPKLVLDILGGPERLPGAIPAVAAAQPGSFQDQTQQGFGQYLAQATNGNKQVPLVFYCLNVQCWMSYNAAARAVALGYSNVLWYRGGIEAWKSAGLPVQR